MAKEVQLLPCPFCGGAMQFRAALWPSDGDVDGIIHATPQGYGCGLIEFTTESADGRVIELWNSRRDQPRLYAQPCHHHEYIEPGCPDCGKMEPA